MQCTPLQEKNGRLMLPAKAVPKCSIATVVPEPCSEPASPDVCSHSAPVFEPGDLVDLEGPSAAPGFRNRPAVVTKVFERHCEVVVVDTSLNCIGECWPNLTDITLRTDAGWRLNQRVYIRGLRHKHRRLLNGSTGVIIEHAQEGHPCFISRHGSEHPQIAVCVRLDEPWERKRSVVLEPKFVYSWDEELFKATSELAEVAASFKPLGQQAEPQAEPSPQSTPASTFRGAHQSAATATHEEPRAFIRSFSAAVLPLYSGRTHLCDLPTTPREAPERQNRSCGFSCFFEGILLSHRSGSRCF